MNERIALYASSLYCVAVESGCEKDVVESISVVAELLKEHRDYAKIMSSAAIALEERQRLLDDAFEERVHPYVLNFMKLLCKKRIFEIIPAVADECEKAYRKDHGVEHATIITAIELSDEKKAEIIAKLSDATKKSILPSFVVDEKILGGIVVKTENSSIDASLNGKLESIKRYISKI